MRAKDRCFNSEKIQRLRGERLDSPSLEWSAAQHKALGHPIRLQVVRLLAIEECCVCDLMNILETPGSTLSQHLKVLKHANLVEVRRDGKFLHYSLSDAPVLESFRLTEV